MYASVLINTNLLIASKVEIKKYFFSSSACAYNKKQQEVFIEGLKEDDAIQLILRMDMMENYLVNGCVDILWKIMEYLLE